MKNWSKFFGLLAIGFALMGGVFSAQAGTVSEEQQAEFRPPVMVVNTSFLNVRTGPSTAYTVLITVTGGTQLPVLGMAADRVWYQVSTAAGVGWINSEFAIGRGEFRNVPIVEVPTPVGVGMDATAPGGEPSQAVFATEMRAWGASVTITHPARLQPAMSATSPGQAFENPDRIYTLMSSASADGAVWYQVDIPELGAVWIEGSKAQLRPYACQMTAVVMRGTARPSVGPDGSGTLTGQLALPPGAEAYLLDAQGAFFKIELADGSTGWLRQDEVMVRSSAVTSAYCAAGGVDGTMAAAPPAEQAHSADRPPGSTQPLVSPARVIVNTPFLNIRSGPGSQFSVITSVPGGTVLDVTGFAPDGVWFRVSGSFGMGWLDSNFAILRGDGSRLPVVNR